MQLILWISGIAVPFYGALGNPILDNLSLFSDFLEGSLSPSSEFDTPSPLPFDSAADILEFSDDASLPIETDQLVDSLDTPVETILDTGPSGPPRENSCGATDPTFQPYSKRDGNICRSKQPLAEPPLVLEWPSLEQLEQSTGSNRVKAPENPLLPIFPIPGYTRVGDQENLCPMPKRRLCCLGPTFGNTNNIWTIVNHCRGKKLKRSPDFLPLRLLHESLLARTHHIDLIHYARFTDFGPWPCPARYDVCCQVFTVSFSKSSSTFPKGLLQKNRPTQVPKL